MSDPIKEESRELKSFGQKVSVLMVCYLAGLAGLMWKGPLSFTQIHLKIGIAEFTGLFLVMAALLFFLPSRRRKERLAALEGWLTASGGMSMLIGGVLLFLLWTQLYRHWAFQTQAYDLRIHEELIRNTWLGKCMFSDILGHSYFSHHVVLLFPFLAPFYVLWPSPVALLVLQAILVCGAAWFLWDIVLRKGIRPLLAASITLTFLAYRGLVTGYYEGFHQEVIAIFFLLGCFHAETIGRNGRYFLWAALAMTCREDVAVMVAIYSGCRAFRAGPMRRTYLGVMILGLAWALIAYGVIIPAYADGRMVEMGRWSFWGNSPWSIVKGFLLHPMMVMEKLLQPAVVRLFALLFFLPLADGAVMITLVIPLIVNVTSSFPLQAHLGGAYAALLVPFLFVGLIRGFTRPAIRRGMDRIPVLIVVSLLLLVVNLRNPPPVPRMDGVQEAHKGLASLRTPLAESRVLAQGCIMPHIGWPKVSSMLGSPLAQAAENYDMVLLSEQLNPWPLSGQSVAELSHRLRKHPTWQCRQMGIITVFTRRDQKTRERE